MQYTIMNGKKLYIYYTLLIIFLNLQEDYVPAPCEAACVLGIINPPVSIEMIEKYIVERGFKEGWIKANPPLNRTGKKLQLLVLVLLDLQQLNN